MTKKKTFLFFISVLIFTLSIGALLIFTISAEPKSTKNFGLLNRNLSPSAVGTKASIADKDSYVDTGNPTSNYGGQDWLYVGEFIGDWNEAYLHFNFSNKPADWIKAEISLNFWGVDETLSVTISLINESWGEYTINWMNKPEHGEVIDEILVTEDRIYKIDVTDYVNDTDGISICVNASDYLQSGYFYIDSSEGGWVWDDSEYPQLIWTYSYELEDVMPLLALANQEENFIIPSYPFIFLVSATVFTIISIIIYKKEIIQ